MKIAVPEHLLLGFTLEEKLRHAKMIGADGVEFAADGLTARVPQVAEALAKVGLQAAAVDAGFTRLVHPDYAERDRAIARLRQAMADSLDLGSGTVVFLSHFQTEPCLPDLSPYKSAVELEAEMLVKQLRATLTDLAYAMGAELVLLPVRQQKAHLVNRLGQAARIRAGTDDHPHLWVGADLDDVLHEEADPLEAAREYAPMLRYVRLNGVINHSGLLAALMERGYDGWLSLTDGEVDVVRRWLPTLEDAAP
ncbi:MAG: sugar phosphate isomerase/epimerase [bacterium]|nr:sugar phosphate isomerase/epimerase [bacterium]